jgi:hypothetical protein
MVTAANGAEEYYGYNNEARSESLEEGIELDRKIQEVWFNNPRYVIVDNSDPSFDLKINRVFDEINDVVSFPVQKFVRKFLLKDVFKREDFSPNIVYSPYKEMIVYLPKTEPNTISFIMKREFENSKKILYMLKKRTLSNDVEKRVETSRMITWESFAQLYSQRNQRRAVINKECFYFRMEDQANVFLYKIETLIENGANFSILHSTSHSGKKSRKFPNFVRVSREITEDPLFFTHKLSKSKYIHGNFII